MCGTISCVLHRNFTINSVFQMFAWFSHFNMFFKATLTSWHFLEEEVLLLQFSNKGNHECLPFYVLTWSKSKQTHTELLSCRVCLLPPLTAKMHHIPHLMCLVSSLNEREIPRTGLAFGCGGKFPLTFVDGIYRSFLPADPRNNNRTDHSLHFIHTVCWRASPVQTGRPSHHNRPSGPGRYMKCQVMSDGLTDAQTGAQRWLPDGKKGGKRYTPAGNVTARVVCLFVGWNHVWLSISW